MDRAPQTNDMGPDFLRSILWKNKHNPNGISVCLSNSVSTKTTLKTITSHVQDFRSKPLGQLCSNVEAATS
jgi:hypothetical protein